MAKQSGLGDRAFVAGYNLSGDTAALSRIAGGHALDDVTGIDKDAFERIGLLRDGGIEWTSFFNPETIAGGGSANRAHLVLKTLPTADRIVTYCRGATLGKPAACLVGKQINYDPNRNADGSLRLGVQALANGYGLEWGEQLTAGIRTDGGATNGASIDTLAAASFGLQAYLHVFAFTGTDATVRIEDSADNVSFAAVADGAFTQVTAGPTSQRIQTARNATIRRYLRASTITTGGFSNLQFAVTVVKNQLEVEF